MGKDVILGFKEKISSQKAAVLDVENPILENLVKEEVEGVTSVEETTTWLETVPRDPCALFVSRLVISLGTTRK